MEQNQIIAMKRRFNSKIITGDFTVLCDVLQLPKATAISRYYRNNEQAVKVMRKIVLNREKLVVSLRKSIK